jgi:kumamolisin
MKRTFASLAVAAAMLFFGFTVPEPAHAAGGKVIVPNSSVERPADAGVRAHTDFVIYQSDVHHESSSPGSNWETPGSMACVYAITGPTGVNPCPIATSTALPTGGGGAIALVDAYDNPDAATDLSTFSAEWGLPAANFTKVYAQGKKPSNNAGGWSLEEALDIEYSHAMAPNAKIILVEAYNEGNADLFGAETTAASMVAADGGGEVSNSWGESETSGEKNDDKYFTTSGIVYLASAGDGGGVNYPSASPNVISAGGTKINRTSGNFTSEVVWDDSSGETGGGPSKYEAIPSWQSGIVSGTKRGTPDYSFNASPYSGVAVYDADGGYDWIQVGGTSVSSPSLAGIVNSAGHFYSSTATEAAVLYSGDSGGVINPSLFRDITSGKCKGYSAGTGWDFCTGLGSNQTLVGK